MADAAGLTAVAAVDRADNQVRLSDADGSLWQFDAGSSAAAGVDVLVPDAGTGRWLRLDDSSVLGGSVANTAALTALTATQRIDNQIRLVDADGCLWQF